MKTTLVPIGNSRGVRIPKPFIDQCCLSKEIEMDVQDNRIIIQSRRHPRCSWDEAFSAMSQNGDDTLVDGSVTTRWDDEEWEWK